VSPGGDAVAFGGPGDGLWAGPPDGTNFTRRSDIQPTCLGFSADGLFACADQNTAPFSIGFSRDLGATFENVLRFESLCGQTACGPDTDCGKTCPGDWQIVGPAVGATCGVDAGVPDAASVSDARPTEDTSFDAPRPMVDARSEAAPPQGSVAVDASGGGCTLRPLPRRGNSVPVELVILLSVAGRCRRRRDQFLTIT
jgi:hypothetical protein